MRLGHARLPRPPPVHSHSVPSRSRGDRCGRRERRESPRSRSATASSSSRRCPAGSARCAATEREPLRNLQFFGCGYPQGGMADYFVIPANRLHVIPDELDDVDAALIEPLSTPVHAGRLAGRSKGERSRSSVPEPSGCSWSPSRVVRRRQDRRDRHAARQARGRPQAGRGRSRRRDGRRTSAPRSARHSARAPTSSSTASPCRSTTLAAVAWRSRAEPSSSSASQPPTSSCRSGSCRTSRSASRAARPMCHRTTRRRSRSSGSRAVRAEDFITGQFPLEQAEQAFEASVSGEHIKVLIHP